MFSDDIVACAQLVERGDPDRFAAAMAAPVEARKILFPLYAFNVEVVRAPWVTQEPMIAEMRLQWWRDALEEIGQGKAARRHEVVTPMSGLLDPEGAELLDRLVAARRWDIYRDPFEDAAHFDRYLEETSGNLMLAAARILGPVDVRTALDMGYASGLTAFLRAVPELEKAGRIPMVDGRPESVAKLARAALLRLDRAGPVPVAVRPAFLPAWQARGVLRMVVKDPMRVSAGALDLSPAGRKFRLMKATATGRF